MERSKEGTSQDEEVKLGTDHPWLRQQYVKGGEKCPQQLHGPAANGSPHVLHCKGAHFGVGEELSRLCLFWFGFGLGYLQ